MGYEIQILDMEQPNPTTRVWKWVNDYKSGLEAYKEAKEKFKYLQVWLVNSSNGNSVFYYDGRDLKSKELNPNKPQTTLPNAKVIKRIGNWTIETFNGPNGKIQLAVSNGWIIDYPLMYNDGRIAYDRPKSVPQNVKTWVSNNYKMYRD